MEKTEQFVFMLDVSGSTGGCQNYWTTVEGLVEKYGKNISKYYLWDDSIRSSSLK
jgi:hypothetical protein